MLGKQSKLAATISAANIIATLGDELAEVVTS